MNIDSVFGSYHTYNERRIAVVTESLTAMNSYYIGTISNSERDVMDYLRINRIAALGDIAAFIGMRDFDAPPFRYWVTFSTSSSVRLARADPLPGTPAFVQMSTSSLLSSCNSFASA